MGTEITRQKLDALFKHLQTEGYVDEVNMDRFRTTYDKKLGKTLLQFDKNGDGSSWVNLSNKKNGRFLSPMRIQKEMGGKDVMTAMFGSLPPMEEEMRLKKIIELQDHDISMDEIDSVHEIITSTATNTDLDMRELAGIDAALQRLKGELANNAGKLSALDERIQYEKGKLEEAETDEQKQKIEERLQKLEEERKVRLELLWQNKRDISSQFARLKESIHEFLDSTTGTLLERLRTLFREEGITITSILVAIITSISTAVLAIISTLTGSTAPTPPKPPKPGGVKAWVKKQLDAIAKLLGRLASSFAAALPGIIGSIVSWLLQFLKKTVVFAANHVWLFIVTVVGAVGYYLLMLSRRRLFEQVKARKNA